MLVQNQGWIYSVVEFERILDKTFAIFDEDAELFGSSEGGLFEPSRQQADILVFSHESFNVLRVNSLHAP